MNLEEVAHLPVERFLFILTLILVGSKIFGEIAERIKQPAVLGELVAGVILGGSVLALVPAVSGEVGYNTFHLLAEVGVAILLFEIGLETDLGDLIKVGPTSAIVAVTGVTVPFALGYLAFVTFEKWGVIHFDPRLYTIIAITIGATLTATSVGITARVLSDLNRLHTGEAKIILGAAVIDDVLGLIILGVVSGLIESFEKGSGGTGVSFMEILTIVLKAFGFLFVSIFLGNLIGPRLFGFVDKLRVRGVLLLFAISFAFIYACLANLVGLAPIVGAFAAGLVLRKANQFRAIESSLKPVADFFTPIFFIMIGAAVNVTVFNPFVPANHGILMIAALLFVVAVIGKYVSGYSIFKKNINKSVVGIGMIPRGEVGLIFAQVGLNYKVFNSELFSAVTVMIMLTTFIAPPLLKMKFKDQDENNNNE